MYGESSPYAYASNPAAGFLYDQMQNTMGGGAYGGPGGGIIGQRFGQVMNSMSTGIQQNAQMGIMPGQGAGNLTPQQVAAQMNIAGPTSVLPYIGGAAMQKIMMPVAGLWSMVDGVRSMRAMGREARIAANNRFNPAMLQYERSLQEMHDVSARWQQLGPLHSGY